MARACYLLCCLNITIAGATIHAQYLFSPRAIGLAAYGASVKDTRGFLANPAGLANMRDWDFTVATYTPTARSSAGFVFHGFALGKRFTEDDAVAVQYTPGTIQDLVLPLKLNQFETPVSIETRISYNEQFSFGYAHRVLHRLSAGLSGRFRQEKVNDTQAQFNLDSLAAPLSLSEKTYTANAWLFDAGLSYKMSDALTVTAVGRNLFKFTEGALSPEFQRFHVPTDAQLALGLGWDTGPVRLALEGSTARAGAFGLEWLPGFDIAVRAGVYCNQMESPFVYAASAGLGWSYGFAEVDVSYLWFLSGDRRNRLGSLTNFDARVFYSIDLNPYTGDRVSLSAKAVIGNVRESLVRIEGVEMLGGIYPSSYEVLAYRPVGRVRVRNISSKPVNARASLYIDKFMDSPTESQPVYIIPGEELEIQLTAVLNESIKAVPAMIIREGTVFVSAAPAEEYDDRFQTRVLIHGKNDWDGDVHSLRYFVTPDDPAVIRYTRDVLFQYGDSLVALPRELGRFHRARILFNTFAGKLAYISDPKQSADYVQYPAETLQRHGGDCDDMAVCFSSLLNSIGISTAFVEVTSPDSSRESHVYLLFDTGVEPKLGTNISNNPKRYVVRKNAHGVETIWIPIETTVMMRGFWEAWTSGAQEYFDDVEVALGLVKGSVRIVDVY